MKNITLLLLLICSFNCFSQDPDPRLFQIWYLTFVRSNDLATPYTISQITPQIAPTLTINNDLTFYGNGACNGFAGQFSFTNSTFQTLQFYQTLSICSVPIHSNVEGSYFNLLQTPIQYGIVQSGETLELILYTPLLGEARFQNFPLSTQSFESPQISVYPNPSSSSVFLEFGQIQISKIELINSVGQNVKTINATFETVDISDLASGVYIMKISTDSGIMNKRLIKI